jgi:sirohydrochlorin ferrochelatase
MNIEEIKARYEYKFPYWEDGLLRVDDFRVVAPMCQGEREKILAHAREDIPALIAEVKRKSKEALSFHAIATEHYEETARLKAQLEAEILRRDSLDETLKSVRAEVERLRVKQEELVLKYGKTVGDLISKLRRIRKAVEKFLDLIKKLEARGQIKRANVIWPYFVKAKDALAEAIKEEK